MHVLNVGKTIGFLPPPHYKAVGGREFADAAFSIWSLLERHLCAAPDFPSDGWIDGFRFETVETHGRDDLVICGLFIWVQGQERWWLDPGSISIRFFPNTEIVAHYTLNFGDAGVGLAKRPYEHGAIAGSRPQSWLFEFCGPNISGLNA